MRPQKTERFLILSEARTGSTMLRRMLNSHPGICCHGEIFAIEIWGLQGYVGADDQVDLNDPRYQEAKRLRENDPARFLREAVWPAGPPPVGAKILYNDLEDPKWRAAYDAVRADRDIRIVHLSRENRLKRLISQTAMNQGHRYIAYETHSIRLRPNGRPEAVPKQNESPVRLTLNPKECLEDFRRVEEAENRIRRAFQGHPVFEATYEKIVDPSTRQLEKLQEFLDVRPCELRSGTLKVHSDNVRDILENLEELQAFFQGTPYERFFV